ncbi:MAG: DASS family sodium-coupled anion symporter [Chlamydiia bacterium]|nr:DASS family sodium-coupled anion symporter [Chlamydiia bacterium]
MTETVLKGIFSFVTGIALWFCPIPAGIEPEGWHLFAIFVATILGIILQPLPMGAMALIGLLATLLTQTLDFPTAFSGFNQDVVWLIVFAFFVARGFVKTGLGLRISTWMLSLLGRHSLGLGYCLVVSDLALAPAIPSNTARCGGVLLPLIDSLAESYGSHPKDPSARRIGAYLIQVLAQADCVVSALFLTGMAANPLIAEMAATAGVELTWMSWFVAASIPALINLALIPPLLFWLYPPSIKVNPHGAAYAKKTLKEMGSIKRGEGIMLIAFILMIALWATGSVTGLKAATVALFGLVLLLITGVLSWQDIKKEEAAWETLIWFSTLLMMAKQLHAFGLTTWFSHLIALNLQGLPFAFPLLLLAYFYAHYFFASNLAHVGALFATFLLVATALGTPAPLAVLSLAFSSSLYGALTHYACGPSAALFGAGFVPTPTWWRLGFLFSLLHLMVWGLVGPLWWHLLGYWGVT